MCRMAYRLKQKHIDAHYIGEALANYLKFPTTFDGSLPSEAIQWLLAAHHDRGDLLLWRPREWRRHRNGHDRGGQ